MDEPKINEEALKKSVGGHHGHDHHGHDHDHHHHEEGKIHEVPSAAKQDAAAEDSEPLSEEGLTPMHIDMVMQNAGCSRNAAIKALRETNNDMVSAIMHLTK